MDNLKKAENGYDYAAPFQESEWDIVPQRREQQRRKKNRRPAVSYVVHPVTRMQRKNAIYNCLTALVVFVLLASVISGYAAISSNKLANIKLQKNIDELAAQSEQVELSINTKCTVQQISDAAEQRFGMDFPSHTQICYVQFSEPFVAEPEAEEQQTPWYAGLWNSMVGLLK